MSFPRYPKYKPSGVEWLGDVPEGWEVKRLKHVAAISMGQSPSSDDCNSEGNGLPFLQGNADFGDTFPIARSFCPVPAKIAGPGDILFSVRAPVGAINTADQEYGIGRGLCAITARGNTFPRYLRHELEVIKAELFSVATGSTYEAVSTQQVGNATFVLPPLPEQTVIAEFLDRETGKIDELVAEQRRLMELLKEKRQAVISHAVTKGLNPHVPMKPSGIEWLGDVPVGWVIGKLGYACKLKGGFAFAAGDFGTDGVAVVKMNNLKRGRLDLSEAARIPESSCNESVALCEGDLAWGMSGSTGETGSLGNFARVKAADLPCQLNQRVGRFKPDSSKLDLDFIEQVIQTPYFYEQIMLLVTGTAQYNVSSEQVQSCIFAVPSLSEQTAIVEFLKTETAKFDTLTAEAQRAIDLLQERRTALISAAVTGQIDVRSQTLN